MNNKPIGVFDSGLGGLTAVKELLKVLPYENIRNLRVDAGMTQQQVAEYLNVKQNTYSQYEIGVLNYPIDVLCRLADLYQVSVDYLLGRTDEKKPYPRKK